MDTSLAGRKHRTEFTLGPHRWLRILDKVLLTILFIGLGVVFLIPFYWMVISSIRSPERIFADCRRTASRQLLLRRLKELDLLEKEAAAGSDDETLIKCQQERMEINQKLKKKL